ncbi:glutathione S-transferase family protein [Reyranella sp.]|uniref:glutathione S-transferase family protein n=1 Tax=Reyranella sp. TaxID=1929291 RepID=UPI0011FE9423|nr:glutathione S-transferase family protein [Reyranella sp.]TAJ83359.1 MAG: glutathione S-transferase family protein [Reyranella sp.]
MKLYSGPLSMFGAKAEIAAREKRLDVELIMVPFEMKRLYEPKHPEVLRINPKRQVPVLIDDGPGGDLEIFDSTQIFEYFETVKPEPPLWPIEPKARARARLLEHKSDEVYFPHIIRLMGLQGAPEDPAAVVARDGAAKFYDEMEQIVGEQEWLAGSYSYADIAFYMAQLFGARMGAPMTDAHPKLNAWRDRMSARPAVGQVAGAMGRYLLSQGRTLPPFLAKLSN